MDLQNDEEIPYLDYTAEISEPLHSVRHIISVFCPFLKADHSELTLHKITGGCLNHMYRVSSACVENREIALVRIHMDNLAHMFDRDKELRLLHFLHRNGLYGKIYGRFRNGVCYEYQKGRALSLGDLREPRIAELIARKVAEFHAVSRKLSGAPACVDPIETIRQMLHALPVNYKDPAAAVIANRLFPHLHQLHREFESLVAHPNMQDLFTNLPVVMCHHDLSNNNMIFNDETETIHLIDFEFANRGYQIEDIGTYFQEFSGLDPLTMSHTLLPDRDYQLNWIRIYLETWNELTYHIPPVNDAQIWNFYVKICRYGLLKLLWNLCFILISEGTTADYIAQAERLQWDALEFGRKKLDIYFAIKTDTLALELMPESLPCGSS